MFFLSIQIFLQVKELRQKFKDLGLKEEEKVKEYLQKIREKAKEALRNILEKLGFGKYETTLYKRLQNY